MFHPLHQWTVWDQPHQDHLPHVHCRTPHLLHEHAGCRLHRPGQVSVTCVCRCARLGLWYVRWPWTSPKAFKEKHFFTHFLSYFFPSLCHNSIPAALLVWQQKDSAINPSEHCCCCSGQLGNDLVSVRRRRVVSFILKFLPGRKSQQATFFPPLQIIRDIELALILWLNWCCAKQWRLICKWLCWIKQILWHRCIDWIF